MSYVSLVKQIGVLLQSSGRGVYSKSLLSEKPKDPLLLLPVVSGRDERDVQWWGRSRTLSVSRSRFGNFSMTPSVNRVMMLCQLTTRLVVGKSAVVGMSSKQAS